MRRVRPAMQAMRRTAASRHAAKSARRSTCPTAPSDISARAALALAFFNHAHGFTLARVTPSTSTGCKLRVEIAVLGNSPCEIAVLSSKNGDFTRGIVDFGDFNPYFGVRYARAVGAAVRFMPVTGPRGAPSPPRVLYTGVTCALLLLIALLNIPVASVRRFLPRSAFCS